MYKKVHIIDDDEISIFLTENILGVVHFAREYVGFPCAKQALTELVSVLDKAQFDRLPDIIFLDLNMPLISGWELLEALLPYEHILSNRCQVYILTSSVDETEVEKAKKYGIVSGFLRKPLEDSAIASISSRA